MEVQSDSESRENLSGLPFLSSSPSGVSFFKLFYFILADRSIGGLNQSGIDGNTFVNAQAFFIKLLKDFAIFNKNLVFHPSTSIYDISESIPNDI